MSSNEIRVGFLWDNFEFARRITCSVFINCGECVSQSGVKHSPCRRQYCIYRSPSQCSVIYIVAMFAVGGVCIIQENVDAHCVHTFCTVLHLPQQPKNSYEVLLFY